MSRPSKIRKIIGNMDRFSSLPDEIAHKIIYCISTRDAARLCVVSKRCRQLFLSTPFVDFNSCSVQHKPIKRAQLINYFERILCLREAKHIPNSFRISWYGLSGEEQEYRFVSWLQKALLCNPANLHLYASNLRKGSDLTLPSAIFSCKSLESLRAVFEGGICRFKIPSKVGFSSLKVLVFFGVRIDNSFFNWISRCCKCLEDLQLAFTVGTNDINITSPSLKVLALVYPLTVVRLRVYAEKLQLIDLVLLNNNTPEWTEPKLFIPNIQAFHKVLLNKTNGFIDLHQLRNKSYSSFIRTDRIFSYVRNFSTSLRCLRMFGDSVQKMADTELLPIQLPNVSEIILEMTHRNVEIVSLMASFFEGTPNLQHLTIHGDDEADGNIETVRQGPDLKNFPLLPLLKDVKFVFPVSVEKRKLELIKYLINSARKIDVNVICAPPLPCDVNTQLNGFQNDATVNVILQDSVSLHV